LLEFLNTWLFHWEPARAIWIAGHTLSWDARCSGIYVGFAVGVAYHAFLRISTRKLPSGGFLILNGMLFLPLFLDVLSVGYGLRTPSNDIKYATGLAFGATLSLYLITALATLMRLDGSLRETRESITYFLPCAAVIAAAFFLKDWRSVVAYGILEGLSFLGFLSLAGVLSAGVLLAARGIADKKPS
jgi:uncharacterized membrane protein